MKLSISSTLILCLAISLPSRARAEETTAGSTSLPAATPSRIDSDAEAGSMVPTEPGPVDRLPRAPVTDDEIYSRAAPRLVVPLIPSPAVHSASSLDVPVLPGRAEPRHADRISVEAPLVVRPRRRMGWFGIGIRAGFADMRLSPPADVVNRLNSSGSGGPGWSSDNLALRSEGSTVTPTLHFGGSGYFFKIDLPVTFAAAFTTWGLGLYPINVGAYIERLALFPYLSLGGAASVVISRSSADPGTADKIIGALVQARGAVGVKYFPVRGYALSAEVGYSPWAAGLLLLSPDAANGMGVGGATQMRGGLGSVTDISFGAECL